MEPVKGADPAARVCPRCGEKAGEQRFCGGCGLNLSGQHELPTRSEWETAHAKSGEATQPSPDAGQQASGSPAMKARSGLDSQLSNARRWYERQPKGGKIAFVLSTTLAVLLVAGVVIGAASSGGGSSRRGGGLWAFDVTCGELAKEPNLSHEIAVSEADAVNSPEGINHSISLIESALSGTCAGGVDPSYSPTNEAVERATREAQRGE
jgi:hypothetical protein